MDQQCLTAQWSWRVSPEGRVHVVVIGCWCPVGPVLASLRSLCVCPTTGGGSCEQRRAKQSRWHRCSWCSCGAAPHSPAPPCLVSVPCFAVFVCPRETLQSLRCKASLGAGRAWWLRWLAVSLWDPAPACPPMRSLRPQLECPVFTHVHFRLYS